MFELTLQKPNQTNEIIQFDAADTPLGQKWKQALIHVCENRIHHPIAQPDRIYNLNSEWSELDIINKLNTIIDTINLYDPQSMFLEGRNTYNPKDPMFKIQGPYMTQQDSNRCHKFFEDMRGKNEDPNPWYVAAPSDIRTAIETYNVLIHRWEDLGAAGRIVSHFFNREATAMEDQDFDSFTVLHDPGDISLNYCHKGKHLWDYYKDQEDGTHAGEEALIPQWKYSADFCLQFDRGPFYNTERAAHFEEWFHRNSNYLSTLGITRDDPRAAIGKAIVGRVIGDVQEIKSRIMGSTKILGVQHVI